MSATSRHVGRRRRLQPPVVFTPLATGSRTAFVTITSTNGLASATRSAPLAGTGNALVAAFSNLTPSQSIFAGTTSITLAGTIGSGTTFSAFR